MYLCRSRSFSDDQEHLKCSSYAKDKDECTAHFIRTAVLKELVLNELNNVLVTIKDNENEFVQTAMERSEVRQSSDIAKAKKTLRQAEKRIEELDRLFKRLYEDNVSGKISDERFETLSNGYEDEQKALKANVAELSAKIENAEQKTSDVSSFIRLVKKYESFTELTPEIMHELIDKIVVHAPDKSSGHRTQEVEIHFRFKAATAITMADSMVYGKKRKAA